MRFLVWGWVKTACVRLCSPLLPGLSYPHSGPNQQSGAGPWLPTNTSFSLLSGFTQVSYWLIHQSCCRRRAHIDCWCGKPVRQYVSVFITVVSQRRPTCPSLDGSLDRLWYDTVHHSMEHPRQWKWRHRRMSSQWWSLRLWRVLKDSRERRGGRCSGQDTSWDTRTPWCRAWLWGPASC